MNRRTWVRSSSFGCLRLAALSGVALMAMLAAWSGEPVSPRDEAGTDGRTTPPSRNSSGVEAAFRRAREIGREVERIRGRPFRQEVKMAVQPMADFRKYLKTTLAEQLGADSMQDFMLALTKVGLLEKPVDLEGMVVDLMEQQAMAHYDPSHKTYYLLMTNMPASIMDITTAHELCHAMQDQYHDLNRFLRSNPVADRDNGDAAGAKAAVTEGEATWVMTHWQLMSQLGRTEPGSVRSMVSAGLKMQASLDSDALIALASSQAQAWKLNSPEMSEAVAGLKTVPRYVVESLLIAYIQGAVMVDEVWNARGWKGVEELYRTPLESTEQLLHPQKWLASVRDSPVDVRLPELTNGIPAGWRLADQDVAGELGIRVYLENWQNPEARSQAVANGGADGWGGDRYYFYVGGTTNQDLLVWSTVWDTAADALEFEMAYRVSLAERFPAMKKNSRGKFQSTGSFQVWEVMPGRFLKLVSHLKLVGIVDTTDRRMLDIIWKAVP